MTRSFLENKKTNYAGAAERMNKELNIIAFLSKCTINTYNMGEVLKNDMRPVDLAETAMNALHQSDIEPIRGGTIGRNYPSRYCRPEYFLPGEKLPWKKESQPVQSMESSCHRGKSSIKPRLWKAMRNTV